MCVQDKDNEIKNKLTEVVENYFNSSKRLPPVDSIKAYTISQVIIENINKSEILELLKTYNNKQDTTLIDLIYKFSFPIAYNSRHTILNDTTEIKFFLNNFKIFWEPKDSDFRKAENNLLKALSDKPDEYLLTLNSKSIRNYYRQYSFYLAENGDSMVFINALCGLIEFPVDSGGVYISKPMDWKNNLILVNDGGDCYWRILINLTKKKEEYFMINGVA